MQTISYFSNYYSELNLPTEEECKLSVAVYEAILSLDKQNDQYFDEIFSVFNAMDDSDHDDISIFFLIPHAKAVMNYLKKYDKSLYEQIKLRE